MIRVKAFWRGNPKLAVAVLFLTMCSFIVGAVEVGKFLDKFDTGTLTMLWASRVETLDDLITDYEEVQQTLLPVLPPEPEIVYRHQAGLQPFALERFPKGFVKNLVGKNAGGYVVYPVTVYEDPETRARIFVNADSKVIASVPASAVYDPMWIAREFFAGGNAVIAWHDPELRTNWDPSRITSQFDLITRGDLIKHVWKTVLGGEPESTKGSTRTKGIASAEAMSLVEGMEAESEAVTNLKVVAVASLPEGYEMVIGYPAGRTNPVEIYARTNLLCGSWSLVATNLSTLNTNRLRWIATNATTETGFYVVGNGGDDDGDGLPSGREGLLYATDPDLFDTDIDGLGDGFEILIQHSDPCSPDSDGDGLVDGYDGFRATNSYPAGVDANQNGYVDGEYDFGADPTAGDSDDDSFQDGFEARCGTSPTDAASFPARLSGTIFYTGGQTGIVRVVAVPSVVVEDDAWAPKLSASTPLPGVYTVSNAPTLTRYSLKAYLDSNGNGTRDAWEAWGAHSSNLVYITGNTVGLDLTLADPDVDGDGMLDWREQLLLDANATDRVEKVNHLLPTGDFDGDGVSNADEYRLGTDPNNAQSRPPVLAFAASQVTVAESNGVALISVNLLPAAAAVVQARVSVIGGWAQNGSDYYFTNQTLAFLSGETHKPLSVNITTNQPGEATEDIVFGLEYVSGPALLGSARTFTVNITDSFTDTDGDGLPDSWEYKYFGNLNQTAVGDPDGDGVLNLQEFQEGMTPTAGFVPDVNNVLKLRVVTPLR